MKFLGKIFGTLLIFIVAALVAQIGVEIFFGSPRPGLNPIVTIILMTYPLILLWRKKIDGEKNNQNMKEESQPAAVDRTQIHPPNTNDDNNNDVGYQLEGNNSKKGKFWTVAGILFAACGVLVIAWGDEDMINSFLKGGIAGGALGGLGMGIATVVQHLRRRAKAASIPTPPSTNENSNDDVGSQLERLKSLLEEGLITEAEAAAKRKSILDEM